MATADARTQPHQLDPLFLARSITVGELSRNHLAELAAGGFTALRVREFLPAELCRAAMGRIAAPDFPMDVYDKARVDPPIARFGPVLNEYKDGAGLRPEYWRDMARARELWGARMRGADPLALSVDRLAAAWGERPASARFSGRDLFAGALREINDGALIHFDDVRREYGPDFFDDGAPVAQLAFNAWMSVPAEGGRTRIYRRRWNPPDTGARNGYGYDRSVIDGEQEIVLSVDAGDALLFDPRYFHAVDPSSRGRRIAITFFLALTSAGKLTLWS